MNESTTRCRPIAVWAIASFAAALLGIFSYVELLFLVFAVSGLVAGGVALQQIHRYELLGRRIAVCGLIWSGVILATSPLWHIWQYRIEAPTGYARLNFSQLARSSNQGLDEFLGCKVFLKGYAYPQRELVVQRFALMATGDPNKWEAMLVVQLNGEATVGYVDEALGVSGILARNPAAEQDSKQPKYLLKESSVHLNRTSYDWSPRTHSMGC